MNARACRSCGRPSRPRGADKNDPQWAGTVNEEVIGLCSKCYHGSQAGAPTSLTFYLVDDFTPEERAQAVCAQTDPEAYFPDKGGSTREAKKVCATCPIRLRCLEVALNRNEPAGIWGGLAPRERRALSRQKGQAA